MQSTGQDFLKNVSRTKLKEAEIEISIFGKGFGECIVLCVGEKDCIIVDSFLNPSTQNPIAIDYLKAIDFDCNRIKFVVLTHWHIDHISGISEILYSANPNVKFVLSPIITKKKFNDFINYAIQEESKSTSEYERVLEFIKQRGASCIKFASHDKRIFATEDSNSNVEIFSLSPQDNDLIRYLRSLVRPDKAGKTAYEFKEDNILSIVLLIKLLDNGILLGSDLETTNKDHEGWDAVVNNYTHLKCHPSIFKVPHHGSENGHNNFVWEKILRQKPISILTAYNKGYKLPKDSDIDRIKKLSEKLYVIGSKSKQDKELKLKIRKLMPDVKIEALPDQIGMVRWRKELNNSEDNGKIDFFGKVYCY